MASEDPSREGKNGSNGRGISASSRRNDQKRPSLSRRIRHGQIPTHPSHGPIAGARHGGESRLGPMGPISRRGSGPSVDPLQSVGVDGNKPASDPHAATIPPAYSIGPITDEQRMAAPTKGREMIKSPTVNHAKHEDGTRLARRAPSGRRQVSPRSVKGDARNGEFELPFVLGEAAGIGHVLPAPPAVLRADTFVSLWADTFESHGHLRLAKC
mmetsp:Transcript_51682/g.155130  ORF Transcript_51682/g.155130 Transcript_51682/m.155130 type:complete len:213 (+) Transcript_51682:387-1025(+)